MRTSAILKHDLARGTVRFVECREDTWDAAAAGIIRKLQEAGVKRGQVLSIDAHAGDEDSDAVFSAVYSRQLAEEGELEVDFKSKTIDLAYADSETAAGGACEGGAAEATSEARATTGRRFEIPLERCYDVQWNPPGVPVLRCSGLKPGAYTDQAPVSTGGYYALVQSEDDVDEYSLLRVLPSGVETKVFTRVSWVATCEDALMLNGDGNYGTLIKGLSIDATADAVAFSTERADCAKAVAWLDQNFGGKTASQDGWNALHAHVSAVAETVGVRDDILALTAARTFRGTSASEQRRAGNRNHGVMYLFHYRDTGLKRDLGAVSYVESRSPNSDAAAADIVHRLQEAGVRRGQILCIDAHASDGGSDAVFSAFYSRQLADEGALEVEMTVKREADTEEGWRALCVHGAEWAEAVGVRQSIVSLTALRSKTSRVLYAFHYKQQKTESNARKFHIDTLELAKGLAPSGAEASSASTDVVRFPFSADMLIKCTQQGASTTQLFLERSKVFADAAARAQVPGRLQRASALEVGDCVTVRHAKQFVAGSIVAIIGEEFLIKPTDSGKILTASACDVSVDVAGLRRKEDAVAQASHQQMLHDNALQIIELCESIAFTPSGAGTPAGADAAAAVSMLVDLTKNGVGTCETAVRLARNILQHAQTFTVGHIQALLTAPTDGTQGPTQAEEGAGAGAPPHKASPDVEDEALYTVLVQHIQGADSATPLVDSPVPATLAAVIALLELPGLSPRSPGKIDLADLGVLLNFWTVLRPEERGGALKAPVESMASLRRSLQRAGSAVENGVLYEECAKYLLLSALLRVISPSLSAGASVEDAPLLGFWREPGEGFVLMKFSELVVSNGSMSAVFTLESHARITVGDRITINSPNQHRQGGQTGTVIRDDETSNPYIVRWDSDGTESGWLEAAHVERILEKDTLKGHFEGHELVFSIASGAGGEEKSYRGKLEKQRDSLVITGSWPQP